MTAYKLDNGKESLLNLEVASCPQDASITVKQSIYDYVVGLLPNGCKRVLFVIPPESPEQDFNMELVLNKRYPCFPPYGPGILARNLEGRGYHGALLDLNFHVLRHAHENPEDFRFRIWEDLLAQRIESFKPDIIGISVMFTIALQSMSQVASYLKEKFPSLPIIAGGICVSNDIESVLRTVPQIDIGSFYEGDHSFPDLLDVVNGKKPVSAIRQVAILKGQEFVSTRERATPTTEEIDIRPEYYDLPIGDYTKCGSMGAYNFMRGDRKASSVLSNRGCRARCSFCAVRNFNDLSVRGREASSVIDELEHLYQTYGITHFTWLDDDLLYNAKRAIRLFNEIVARNLKITWDATNGLIAAAITPEIMHAASESGCIGVHLGLESGNDDILRAIHKPGTTKNYRRAKEILDSYPHIFVKGYLIIGFPFETMRQIRETVSLARELQFAWYPLQLLTPLPGTEITLSMVEQGLIQPPDPKEAKYWGMAAGSKSKSGGALRQREMNEKIVARDFVDLLESPPDDHVPTTEELNELWFVADYRMNYEKILDVHEPIKLRNIQMMLKQLTDEYTKDNALGNLYLSVIASKLRNPVESNNRLALAEKYQRESAYWTKRFEALGMYEVADGVRAANSLMLSA
jgi:radical SAM superfamily enzyme YgiQ (UPF0313 family)